MVPPGLKKVLEDCCGQDRYRCIVQSRDSLIFGAVDAVLSELLSATNSPVTGKNTGNSLDFVQLLQVKYTSIGLYSGRLLESSFQSSL